MLAFYGDDFTGSTDALEFICRAGAKAVLFIEPPTPEQLAAYPDLDAYGVAGFTRSLPPGEMESILVPAFRKIKATNPTHVHYKVCSTFDSSPDVGSIGEAIDCGAVVFENKIIPVLGGMPALGRYCVFGNLFAKMGTVGEGEIYRVDRHPSMSKHPVTPADESDLRLHLGKQTNKTIGLVDVLELKKAVKEIAANHTEQILLIDVLEEEQLSKIGEWLDGQAQESNALFIAGSSAVELALGNHWNKKLLLKPTVWDKPAEVKPLLVVSGSCSPVTAAQIVYAKSKGFAEVVIDPAKISAEEVAEAAVMIRITALLKDKLNVIVHTGEKQTENLSSATLGALLGAIVKAAAEKSKIKRVVVAGGDTSSYTARAMEIESVEMVAPFVIGAPLCRAVSHNPHINALEVNFKGGQVGGEDYFVKMIGGEELHGP